MVDSDIAKRETLLVAGRNVPSLRVTDLSEVRIARITREQLFTSGIIISTRTGV